MHLDNGGMSRTCTLAESQHCHRQQRMPGNLPNDMQTYDDSSFKVGQSYIILKLYVHIYEAYIQLLLAKEQIQCGCEAVVT